MSAFVSQYQSPELNAAIEFAEKYAVPANDVVKERVRKMQFALMLNPMGYQIAECEHCGDNIARRFPLEGKPSEWRHFNNAYRMCAGQEPASSHFNYASPKGEFYKKLAQ